MLETYTMATATYQIKQIEEISIVALKKPNMWNRFWDERGLKLYFIDQDGEEHMVKVWISKTDIMYDLVERAARKIREYITTYNNRFSNPTSKLESLVGATISVKDFTEEDGSISYKFDDLLEEYVRSNSTL